MGKRTYLTDFWEKCLQHLRILSDSCGDMPTIADLYIIQMIGGSVNVVSHNFGENQKIYYVSYHQDIPHFN